MSLFDIFDEPKMPVDPVYKRFCSECAMQKRLLHDGTVWQFCEMDGTSGGGGGGGGGGSSSGAADNGDGPDGDGERQTLVCVAGTAITARGFYRQLLSLSAKGYRAIAIQCCEGVWTHREWAASFERLLEQLALTKVHLYGVGLGGFLSLVYTTLYPGRVESIALTHAFADATYFHDSAPCVSGFPYCPAFYLRSYITDSFPKWHPGDARMQEASDFVQARLGELPQESLAVRLTLNCTVGMSHDIAL